MYWNSKVYLMTVLKWRHKTEIIKTLRVDFLQVTQCFFFEKVTNMTSGTCWIFWNTTSVWKKNWTRWDSPFNLRPAWGVLEHPLRFLRIAKKKKKRRRAASPVFYLPYPPSFWQLLWKFPFWVMQGQVTRSGQVTIPYKNFTFAPQLQCLRKSYETC